MTQQVLDALMRIHELLPKGNVHAGAACRAVTSLKIYAWNDTEAGSVKDLKRTVERDVNAVMQKLARAKKSSVEEVWDMAVVAEGQEDIPTKAAGEALFNLRVLLWKEPPEEKRMRRDINSVMDSLANARKILFKEL